MKKIFFIIFLIFNIASLLFAAESDEGLPMDTSARIKESVTQVVGLGVENDAVIKMTKTMLEHNFMEQQILDAHEVLIRAKKEDLPEGPIIDKLHEGVAKNVQAENIVQAMEKVRSRYETADSYAIRFLGDGEQARVMTGNIAEAMTAGVGTGEIDQIIEMVKQRGMKTDKAADLAKETLKTARDMARTGVESRNIVDIVDNAFRKGYGAGEMQTLGNVFMKQARTSSSPSEVASSLSSAIKQGATADSLMKSAPWGLLDSPDSPQGAPGIIPPGTPGDPSGAPGSSPPSAPGGTPPSAPGGSPPSAPGGSPPSAPGGSPPSSPGGSPPSMPGGPGGTGGQGRSGGGGMGGPK